VFVCVCVCECGNLSKVKAGNTESSCMPCGTCVVAMRFRFNSYQDSCHLQPAKAKAELRAKKATNRQTDRETEGQKCKFDGNEDSFVNLSCLIIKFLRVVLGDTCHWRLHIDWNVVVVIYFFATSLIRPVGHIDSTING